MWMLVLAEKMAVNKILNEKLSVHLFIFKIPQSAVKGTKMFMVSIRITTVQTQRRFVAQRQFYK